LARYGQFAIFGPEALTALNEATKGKFITGPVSDGKSRVVARLADIQYIEGENEALERETYSQRLRESLADDVINQFADEARSHAGVSIDEARFKTFHEGE
jgi:hypothetical protein